MQVPAINPYSVSRATSGDADAPITAAKKATLGQDDFLKLLAKQFQTQDPMKPMEDTAFIAQMAQFTSLEQTSTMSKDIAQLRLNQDFVTASTYLGRNVTVDLGDGITENGNVTAVDASSGSPKLVINGQTYSLSEVLRVEPGTVPSPQPTSAPAAGV